MPTTSDISLCLGNILWRTTDGLVALKAAEEGKLELLQKFKETCNEVLSISKERKSKKLIPSILNDLSPSEIESLKGDYRKLKRTLARIEKEISNKNEVLDDIEKARELTRHVLDDLYEIDSKYLKQSR